MTSEANRLYQLRRKEDKRLVKLYWSWKLNKLPVSMIARREKMDTGILLTLFSTFDDEYQLANRYFEEV